MSVAREVTVGVDPPRLSLVSWLPEGTGPVWHARIVADGGVWETTVDLADMTHGSEIPAERWSFFAQGGED